MSATVAERPRIRLHDLAPQVESFRDAVLRGLGKAQKEIPCKFFYDERGSKLFDEICGLEEYYLTRTEIGILEDGAAEIAALIGPRAWLIEFGSGSSRKVRVLLDALEAPAAYMPIDISRGHLIDSASALAQDYPDLDVVPVCADYSEAIALPAPAALGAADGAARQVGFFPGSSIGNFAPPQAEAFLARLAGLLGPGAGLLIAADLKKDGRVLEAAYNDAHGVTAAFNLNLLVRANRELDADFDLAAFRHDARYDAARGRIEMHLVSRKAQTARIAGRAFEFAEGETIHTENSYKYDLEEFLDLAGRAGFEAVRSWTDDARLLSIHYLRAA